MCHLKTSFMEHFIKLVSYYSQNETCPTWKFIMENSKAAPNIKNNGKNLYMPKYLWPGHLFNIFLKVG